MMEGLVAAIEYMAAVIDDSQQEIKGHVKEEMLILQLGLYARTACRYGTARRLLLTTDSCF